MRRLALGLIFGLNAGLVAGETAPSFPYAAYVASDGVTVRSGPGSHFYPCDRLAAGDAVEVYRHDPGGWCAVRPPEGSYSWVAGRYLRLVEAGLAVVEQPRVPARIGSRFSSVRDVIQVRLEVGETVELLGEAPAEAEAVRPEWFKIAPPAGEFRWIHADFLTTSPPEGGPSAARGSVEETPPPAESPDEAVPAEGDLVWNGVGDRSKISLASGEQAELEGAKTAATPTTDDEEVAAEGEQDDPAKDRPLAVDDAVPEAEPGAAGLDDVELDLSLMAAGDASRWRLGPLRREVERIVSESPSPAVRGRGRALLSKLGRFEDIQSRHFALLGLPPAGNPPPGNPGAGGESSFDGQGRLTPVVSRKPGAPQFALLNSAGEVVCFVTAAPGANLRHYVGKQVGLTGVRGYLPEFKARHVTARRVTVLDPPKWR